MIDQELLEQANKVLSPHQKQRVECVFLNDLMKRDLLDAAECILDPDNDTLIKLKSIKETIHEHVDEQIQKLNQEIETYNKSEKKKFIDDTYMISYYHDLSRVVDNFQYFINAMYRIREEQKRRIDIFQSIQNKLPS